jgi:hypothetical protein
VKRRKTNYIKLEHVTELGNLSNHNPRQFEYYRGGRQVSTSIVDNSHLISSEVPKTFVSKAEQLRCDHQDATQTTILWLAP